MGTPKTIIFNILLLPDPTFQHLAFARFFRGLLKKSVKPEGKKKEKKWEEEKKIRKD